MVTFATARLRAIATFIIMSLFVSISNGIFVNAFEHKETPASKSVVTVRIQYTGTSASTVNDSSLWKDLSSNPTDNCDEAEELPCIVEFDTSQYSDAESFLEAHPTLEDIMNAQQHLISTKSEG